MSPLHPSPPPLAHGCQAGASNNLTPGKHPPPCSVPPPLPLSLGRRGWRGGAPAASIFSSTSAKTVRCAQANLLHVLALSMPQPSPPLSLLSRPFCRARPAGGPTARVLACRRRRLQLLARPAVLCHSQGHTHQWRDQGGSERRYSQSCWRLARPACGCGHHRCRATPGSTAYTHMLVRVVQNWLPSAPSTLPLQVARVPACLMRHCGVCRGGRAGGRAWRRGCAARPAMPCAAC